MQFRHIEFLGALSSVLGRPCGTELPIAFQDALSYDASVEMSEMKIASFNSAMQSIEFIPNAADVDIMNVLVPEAFMKAAQRCSLVHAIYKVVAEQDTYNDLSDAAMRGRDFNDVMVGGANQNATWALRVRHYGDMSTEKKAKRYGARARSITLEREALKALKPLLLKFGGRVDLLNPDCKIYVFDGLLGRKKVLARRLATGPQVSEWARLFQQCPKSSCMLTPILAMTQTGFHHGSQYANLRHKHAAMSNCSVRHVQRCWGQGG